MWFSYKVSTQSSCVDTGGEMIRSQSNDLISGLIHMMD